MCEPLQNLILDIRVVIVTCNNCSLLTCLFKAGFHVSQCNSRSQFYPFPIILSRPRNRDRGKEKKEKKEREALPSSPLFRHHQEGKQIKLLPLLLPFLIFSTREKKKKKILSFPPPFFLAVFFSLVSAPPRRETGKTHSFVFSFLDFRHQGGEKGKKKKTSFFLFFCRGGKGEKEEPIFVPPLYLPFHLRLRGSHHLVRSMAEEEKTPIVVDVEIAKKSLLPLQDPWYCSSPLFPMVPTNISASNAPSQWNIRGESPNSEISWVSSPPGVMDLRLQRKELLPSPVQFWCLNGLIKG